MPTYVCPIRCERPCPPGAHEELVAYLRSLSLAGLAEVLVVDGSPEPVLTIHAPLFSSAARHLRVDGARSTNGKVDGVRTGVLAASNEAVILADDDVRYEAAGLRAVEAGLAEADLVLPQNAFARPMPWHARWDTARSLMNRAWGIDYPGTMAIRRSRFVAMGGYDGDVLFENLELLRTVRAHGGVVRSLPSTIVARRAPSLRTFLAQRPRQAYDDLAQPWRLAVWLAVLPVSVAAFRRGRGEVPLAIAAAAVALATQGRGNEPAFPVSAVAFAPLWVAERAICAWLAVASRLALGGCRYRGRIVARAATPTRVLRARMRARQGAGRASVAA